VTIQELGSLGELVGAVATVATLVYLSFQVRQNTSLLRASVAHSDRDARNDISRLLAADPETARVYRHGLLDPSALTENEKFQFDAMMDLVFTFHDQARSQGSVEHNTLLWLLSQPGARGFWEEFGGTHSASFDSVIRPLLKEVEIAAQQSAAADSA
jgi:hypothetical protein